MHERQRQSGTEAQQEPGNKTGACWWKWIVHFDCLGGPWKRLVPLALANIKACYSSSSLPTTARDHFHWLNLHNNNNNALFQVSLSLDR